MVHSIHHRTSAFAENSVTRRLPLISIATVVALCLAPARFAAAQAHTSASPRGAALTPARISAQAKTLHLALGDMRARLMKTSSPARPDQSMRMTRRCSGGGTETIAIVVHRTPLPNGD